MPNKIKITAKPAQDCEYFEVSFFDGSHETAGGLLKRLFESAGWSVKERRPNGMDVIWEVHLPFGNIVDQKILNLIIHSMNEVKERSNCRFVSSF